MDWIKRQVHFDQQAFEATLLDYVQEVDHAAARIERLEKSIDEAIATAPMEIRAVVEALQSLRGVAKMTAVTIVRKPRPSRCSRQQMDGWFCVLQEPCREAYSAL
jgi:hypothetical protein